MPKHLPIVYIASVLLTSYGTNLTRAIKCPDSAMEECPCFAEEQVC